MSYKAEVIKDSISPDGYRLVTMVVRYPRFILAELNTHRAFSRNTSSNRALPLNKILDDLANNFFIPEYWGKNQKGMQAAEQIGPMEALAAHVVWEEAFENARNAAEKLLALGVHKQTANRLLEPFMWSTTLITATEWENFFALRVDPDAQPEMYKLAGLMQQAYMKSKPSELNYDEWHLPFINDEDSDLRRTDKIKVAIARCARISYLTHDGKRSPKDDLSLYGRLLSGGHLSPTEHVATPMYKESLDNYESKNIDPFLGNVRGWVQFRKLIPNENNFKKLRPEGPLNFDLG